jgi:hypothetical protein
MTDSENQLHAAGSLAKHGGFHHDKGCSNAFGDNPMRVLVPLLEFNPLGLNPSCSGPRNMSGKPP